MGDVRHEYDRHIQKVTSDHEYCMKYIRCYGRKYGIVFSDNMNREEQLRMLESALCMTRLPVDLRAAVETAIGEMQGKTAEGYAQKAKENALTDDSATAVMSLPVADTSGSMSLTPW